MAVEIQRHRFTRHQYHKMGKAGILRAEDRVELIRGEIVKLSPINPPHMSCVDRTNYLFVRKVGDRAIVRIQGAVVLDDESEPQPDVLILNYREDFYASRITTSSDVLLLIEISDTSLAYDQKVKMPLYAEKQVQESWVLDINRRLLHVYRDPGPDGFRSIRIVRPGQTIAPIAFPEWAIDPVELLG